MKLLAKLKCKILGHTMKRTYAPPLLQEEGCYAFRCEVCGDQFEYDLRWEIKEAMDIYERELEKAGGNPWAVEISYFIPYLDEINRELDK